MPHPSVEEAAQLVAEAIEALDPNPDMACADAVVRGFKKVRQLRAAEIEQLTAERDTLQRQLHETLAQGPAESGETLRRELAELGVVAAGDAASFILQSVTQLEQLAAQLAQDTAETEHKVAELRARKIRLLQRKKQLEQQQELELEHETADLSAMAVTLFKRLGMFLDTLRGKDRIVVVDVPSNSSAVLEVEDKYSDYFITNYIWDHIGKSARGG